MDELECCLCLKILYDPITVPCGHSFCRKCLERLFDHSTSCPLCREVLHIDPHSYPSSVVLKTVITKLFPNETEERRQEEQREASEANVVLPQFLLNAIVFPGSEFPMHIFEPRYRLMLRRILQGHHKFGLIVPKAYLRDEYFGEGEEDSKTIGVGVMLKVTHQQQTPDGRSFIQTSVLNRYKLMEPTWECDGYLVGSVKLLEDEKIEGEELSAAVQQAQITRDSLCSLVQNSNLADRLEEIPPVGTTFEELLCFYYRVCDLIPISIKTKAKLLASNARDLFTMVNQLVLNICNSHFQSCGIS